MNLKRLGLLLDPKKGLCRLEDHPHYLTAGPDLLSRQEDDLKKKFGLIDLNVDITTMNLRTLRRYFGHKTEETIDGALFIRNVIWQLYRFTKAGKPPPIIENGGTCGPSGITSRSSFGPSRKPSRSKEIWQTPSLKSSRQWSLPGSLTMLIST